MYPASASFDPVSDIRILTFNVWGLKYIAKHRDQRITHLGHLLASRFNPSTSESNFDPGRLPRLSAGHSHKTSDPPYISPGSSPRHDYDIICFQEVFTQGDAEFLQRKGREGGLPYSRWFRSGIVGSGLLTLSKYPIVSSTCIPYVLSGYPFNPTQGDWFVNKAVGKTVLDLGNGNHLAVFNTHTHSPGDDGEPGKWQAAHRVAQMWQLSKLINAATASGQHVVLCGDLNSQPDSILIEFLISATDLHDTWADYVKSNSTTTSTATQLPNGSASSSSPHPDIEMKTCDSPLNTYSASKNLKMAIKRQGGKRLDYIFTMTPLKVLGAALTLTHTIPHLNQSVSDHFGYTATISYPVPSNVSTNNSLSASAPVDNHSNASTQQQQPPPPPVINTHIPSHAPFENLSRSTLTKSLALLSLSNARNKRMLYLNIACFVVCAVLLLPALAIGSSFQPHSYLNWLFVLLATALGVLGTTLIYAGLFSALRERNTSDEVTKELQELLCILERRDLDSIPPHPALRTGW